MKKRLRKKHRLAEFTEWGLKATGRFKEPLTPEAQEAFWLYLIPKLEAAGFMCGGGGGHVGFAFVISKNLKRMVSCTEQDVEFIKGLLERHPQIIGVRVTLMDLNHDWEAEDPDFGWSSRHADCDCSCCLPPNY